MLPTAIANIVITSIAGVLTYIINLSLINSYKTVSTKNSPHRRLLIALSVVVYCYVSYSFTDYLEELISGHYILL